MSWTSVYEDNRPAWVVFESAIADAPGVQPADDEWLSPQPSLPAGAAIHS